MVESLFLVVINTVKQFSHALFCQLEHAVSVNVGVTYTDFVLVNGNKRNGRCVNDDFAERLFGQFDEVGVWAMLARVIAGGNVP